jgi:hypothetical protein
MANVGVTFDFAAESAKLRSEIDKVRKELSSINATAKGIKDGFKTVGTAIAGALSVGAITAWLSKVNQAADQLNDLSTRLGASASGLQTLQVAAQQAGGSAEAMATGLSKLQVTIGEGLQGNKKAAEAFQQLGLSARELAGLKTDEAMRRVAVALSDGDAVDWEQIGKQVDLEQFLRFWVAEILADHWDGYANNQNNYFIHRRASDGRLVFIPWGADQCLGSPNPFTPRGAPVSVRATGLLARRLYQDPEWRERYREQLRKTLDAVWNEERWLAEIDRLDGLISTNGWSGITGRKAVVQKTREFFEEKLQ